MLAGIRDFNEWKLLPCRTIFGGRVNLKIAADTLPEFSPGSDASSGVGLSFSEIREVEVHRVIHAGYCETLEEIKCSVRDVDV